MDGLVMLSCTLFDQLNIFVRDNILKMIERVNFFNSRGYWLMAVDYKVYLQKVDNFLIEFVKVEVSFNLVINCLEFN